ncbi:oocyte zinc finger protein XlCOF6-like [Centruroides sculpturatus]|uniref:oocyte zinc finger protein XlCOF6-like n=1 Tax=Centruroides sculpturatus TaxID=218467 RepID=UPI000C6CD955|nr:oocyte zinc finger protein XlCOF6-like [Centruroides sculpturatus]
MTPGLFYKEWESLIFRYSKSDSNIANEIKNAIVFRENHLLDNNILLAGIYVYPMVRCLLTQEQENRAKNALFELAIRIKGLKIEEQATTDDITQILTHELPSSSKTPCDSEEEFEKYLDEQDKIKRPRLTSNMSTDRKGNLTKFRDEFYHVVKKVNSIDRSSNLDVKTAILHYPDIIQDTALNVTALPPAQVSVERLFSALKIIKSDLRASMNADLIESIFFLRKYFYLCYFTGINNQKRTNRKNQCDICKKEFASKYSLKSHERIHTGEGLLSCRFCNRKFNYSSNLNTHVKIHTGEKSFMCDHCKRSFTQKEHLIRHLRTHTGEKPFTCDYCKRSFAQGGDLIKHLRTHTGEKPFTCDYCKRSFAQGGDLIKHLRTHTGEKPFTCDYCKRSFAQRGDLINHLRTHTGEKPFTCDYCKRNFTRKSTLIKHLRLHTGEKPFT